MTLVANAVALLALAVQFAAAATFAPICPPLAPKTINAGPWAPCPNVTDVTGLGKWSYPGMQCRTVYVPTTYTSNRTTSALVGLLERRLVKGTPRSIVYLVGGGMEGNGGGNADKLALSTAKVVATALNDNFAIYVPSLRGTLFSTSIPDYPAFPANFWTTVNKSGNGTWYSDYSVTNTAQDLIYLMNATQKDFKNATLNVFGFSFGTYIVQRAMTLQPGMIDGAILDSAVGAVNGSNSRAINVLGSVNLATYLMTNCQKSPACKAASLTRPRLVSFLNDVNNLTNPCVTSLVGVLGFPPATPRSDVLSALLRGMVNFPNLVIPKALLSTNASALAITYQTIQAYLNTASLDTVEADEVAIDFRALALALLNQLAQCDPNNPQRQVAFANAMQSIAPVIRLFSVVGASAATDSNSVIGRNRVTGLLNELSEGRLPNITVAELAVQQQNSYIRYPSQFLGSIGALDAAAKPVPAMTDCFSNKPVRPVQTRTIFLAGRLDPIVPVDETRRAFRLFRVNGALGGKKTIFIHNNAGNEVLGNGYSRCVNFLIRGVVLKTPPAIVAYQNCLATENAQPLPWAQASLSNAVNASAGIWAGLSSGFTMAPTMPPSFAPTRAPTPPTASPTTPPPSKSPTTPPPSKSPTTPPPTAKPTTAMPSRAPSTSRPSKAPITFKALCNSLTTQATCTAAGCTWRPRLGTCTTGTA